MKRKKGGLKNNRPNDSDTSKTHFTKITNYVIINCKAQVKKFKGEASDS